MFSYRSITEANMHYNSTTQILLNHPTNNSILFSAVLTFASYSQAVENEGLAHAVVWPFLRTLNWVSKLKMLNISSLADKKGTLMPDLHTPTHIYHYFLTQTISIANKHFVPSLRDIGYGEVKS